MRRVRFTLSHGDGLDEVCDGQLSRASAPLLIAIVRVHCRDLELSFVNGHAAHGTERTGRRLWIRGVFALRGCNVSAFNGSSPPLDELVNESRASSVIRRCCEGFPRQDALPVASHSERTFVDLE